MTRNVLMGVLGAGWLLWLYNVVRYRGLARTTVGLIEQNTRLIDANESLRWQNSSLLGERDRRARADAAAAAAARDSVIDLTAAGDAGSMPQDESSGAGG